MRGIVKEDLLNHILAVLKRTLSKTNTTVAIFQVISDFIQTKFSQGESGTATDQVMSLEKAITVLPKKIHKRIPRVP